MFFFSHSILHDQFAEFRSGSHHCQQSMDKGYSGNWISTNNHTDFPTNQFLFAQTCESSRGPRSNLCNFCHYLSIPQLYIRVLEFRKNRILRLGLENFHGFFHGSFFLHLHYHCPPNKKRAHKPRRIQDNENIQSVSSSRIHYLSQYWSNGLFIST